MMDHFTKYGWVISLKDNKAEPILRALKNVSSNIIFLISIRLINERAQNNVLKIFVNRKELLEYMEYIITLCIKEQRRYSIELFKISLLQKKITKKEKYNLEESINDFLIYYNGREHSNTKVAPLRAIMNYENKDLI